MTTGDDATLDVEDLSVTYAGACSTRLALDQVSLHVDQGEILGVVGESGSGKSTLSMAILGLLPSTATVLGGSVSLAGYGDLARVSVEQMRTIRGSQVSMIFQDPTTSLNPRLTIGAQLNQVLNAHADPTERNQGRRDLLEHSLSEVGIPNPRAALRRYPHEFSGGMRQRVMIAMALLLHPKLVIADEATAALDVTLEAQILELLLRLRDEHGTSILFVSHDLGVVSQLCDRVSVLYAGRVVEELAGTAVLAAPAHPYTQALNAAVPSPDTRGRRLATVAGQMPDVARRLEACGFAQRCRHTTELCRTAIPDAYPTPTGAARCFAQSPAHRSTWPTPPATDDWRPADDPRTPTTRHDTGPEDGEPLVRVSDVSVHFGGHRSLLRHDRPPVRAVDEVSLTLRRGRVLGIVGESGSGKTTLGEALIKIVDTTGGTITFDGQDYASLSATQTRTFRRRVQMIFQSPYSSLSPRMRVGDQVTEPYRIHHVHPDRRRTAEELLALVNLPSSLTRALPSELSGGQARRVGIARALACEPDLIVADEPTSGLDPSAAAAAINLLADLTRERGLTVILISHSLPQVMSVTHEICVMYFGRVVERGSTDAVTTRPAHPYTKALLALAPHPNPGQRLTRRRLLVPGEVPSSDAAPGGCVFHPRCNFADDLCRTTNPSEVALGNDDDHHAACHYAHAIADGTRTPRRQPDDTGAVATTSS